MINTELRRVKTLRLSAPTDSSLRRGQILTEDALRTASLPDAIGGRVLIVRSLRLEAIRSHHSAASLALAIEQSLYNLGSQSVHAEETSASSSPAVYFRDEVEPYVCLSLRLASGQRVTDWFWPLAVPFWRPAMSRDEALRSLLNATLQTQAGVAAAVTLVRELFERGALAPLLAALRWQEGPALLKACGWSHASLPLALVENIPSHGVQQTLLRWKSPLATWVKRWGADDARSGWLAAIALAAENPARLQAQTLMSQARQVIKLVTPGEQRRRAAEQDRLIERQAVPMDAASKTAALHPEPSRFLSGDDALTVNAAPLSKPSSPPLVPDVAEGDARPDLAERRSIEARSDTPEEARRADEMVGREALDEVIPLLNSSSVDSSEEAREAALPALSDDLLGEVKPQQRPEESPLATAYAGLFFLIPVLSRLGFSSMLDANLHLIEYHLPERFLSFVGERLGIPDSDPAISLFVTAVRSAAPAPSSCEFIVPSVWLEGLCRRGPLVVCRTPDEPLKRTLRDSSEKLTLALWRGGAPQSVRALIGDARLKRALSPREDDLQVLLESWLIAARRWCRRFARIGLSELVSRVGRISQTRTHIDVMLDHRQADVRVRKAGLDLNPGWVAWLGRVVTFHYLYGEQGNGR